MTILDHVGLAVAEGGACLIQGEEEDVVRPDELLTGHQTPAKFQQPITQQRDRHADGEELIVLAYGVGPFGLGERAFEALLFRPRVARQDGTCPIHRGLPALGQRVRFCFRVIAVHKLVG